MKISEVVEQNPWWAEGEDFSSSDNHLKGARPIFFKRRPLKMHPNRIYILRGPRQVGKSTYLKETIERLLKEGVRNRDIMYLSVDFFTSRRELRGVIEYFFESTITSERIYIFFDEITALPDWNQELKRIADLGAIQRAVIVCSGSSAFRLKEKAELLPGRGLEGNEYYIKPLCFREYALQLIPYISKIVSSEGIKTQMQRLLPILSDLEIHMDGTFDDLRSAILDLLPFRKILRYIFRLYLITGGVPYVINHFLQNYKEGNENISSEVSEIYIRSVMGDISKLGRQEILAREILKTLVTRYGSRFSFSKLSHTLGRNHATIIDYLDIMEQSFIILIHYALDFARKEIKYKGNKKIFFLDPFIYYSIKSYLRGVDVWDIIRETLENEELLGCLIEGIVITHLIMRGELPYLRNGKTFLWYYYDKSGKEIDAVYRLKRGFRAIEIKYQMNVDKRDIKRVSDIDDYIILSREDFKVTDNLIILPVDIFLALLPVSKANI